MNEDFYQFIVFPAIIPSGASIIDAPSWVTVASGLAVFPQYAVDAPTELWETAIWSFVYS